MEKLYKIAKLNYENPMENEEQVERSDVELSDMDKLPNEILMQILDYLDERKLVKCRHLSLRWNEISCLLLQDKGKNNPDSRLVVQLKEYKKCKTVITKPLADFLECFSPPEAEKSSGRRPFPFSRFHIKSLELMDVPQICEFVSTFGPQMKTVIINIKRRDVSNFVRFWKLFLYFAPNIQQLRIISDSALTPVMLFDPINKFIAESDPNLKAVNPSDTFLKKLIKLEIVSRNFGQLKKFMKDLLDNTPNLEQVSSVEPVPHGNYVFQHLEIWQTLNKAHLLKKLEIKFDSRSNLSPAQLMKNLRLVNLRADCRIPFNSKQHEKSMSNYIYHALKSSQDTLSSLDLDGLSVESMKLCLKDIKSLPNVRELNLEHAKETGKVLERVSQFCPNIKILSLGCLQGDFSIVTWILWTEFKGLKSLKFTVDMTGHNYDFLFLDSAISGYSVESIQKIQINLGEEMSLEEARRGEVQNPSILDLKGLNRLELKFFMGERTDEMKQMEKELEDLVSFKILPQIIREYSRSILFRYSSVKI